MVYIKKKNPNLIRIFELNLKLFVDDSSHVTSNTPKEKENIDFFHEVTQESNKILPIATDMLIKEPQIADKSRFIQKFLHNLHWNYTF